jgi:hypothetical protein
LSPDAGPGGSRVRCARRASPRGLNQAKRIIRFIIGIDEARYDDCSGFMGDVNDDHHGSKKKAVNRLCRLTARLREMKTGCQDIRFRTPLRPRGAFFHGRGERI